MAQKVSLNTSERVCRVGPRAGPTRLPFSRVRPRPGPAGRDPDGV